LVALCVSSQAVRATSVARYHPLTLQKRVYHLKNSLKVVKLFKYLCRMNIKHLHKQLPELANAEQVKWQKMLSCMIHLLLSPTGSGKNAFLLPILNYYNLKFNQYNV
jgi:hypothetical protein